MSDKGATLKAEGGVEAALVGWLKEALHEKVFDALLIPVEAPAGDSFAYLLLQDPAILDKASPLPPVMPVQGGKAINRLTMRGSGSKQIAAIVRPCEARAAIELAKLKQAYLDKVCLITLDCPGVLPLSDYIGDPAAGAARFAEAAAQGDRSPMRPTCQMCNHFSLLGSDLHVGTLGMDGTALIIPGSAKGKGVLEDMGEPLDAALDGWRARVEEMEKAQTERRRQAHADLRERVAGAERLLDVFSSCINCHNCQRVCPVCYCRQCYFESAALKLPSENYLARAERKGALRFLPDTLLFHVGRASHMALSCVSCGACEDACPMDIPVGQVFSLMADRAQEMLGYVAGRKLEEALPLVAYEMDELHQVEQPYVEIYCQQGVQDG
ncbi:MAG: 4Fe-4S dicluster domain-containing protein [Candidatus Aminicenantes bacterium]|nr:4Fe-4S dicluster domain-containing protein [Candidatus Aminicenantes bacterium]